MKNLQHYRWLAEMFRYPWEKRNKYLDLWESIILNYDPALLCMLEPFKNHILSRPLAEQQEYYIGTFDVQALCCLDVGYVLFGDDSKRMVFLSYMRKEQELADNPCFTELSDFLPNILKLLPKMKDQELAEELICSVMKPALEAMISGFRSFENVYRGLLQLVLAIMEKDYPVSEFEKYRISDRAKSDFIRSVSVKMNTHQYRPGF